MYRSTLLFLGMFVFLFPAGRAFSGEEQKLPPVRAITSGPKCHWFGYYDKLQFDPTSRYVLSMEVDFEHRSPRPDDRIVVGMVDLENNDKWIPLGESRAWCWQQGCMLQWRPGSKREVLWNDRVDGKFVCHILDVVTRKKRTIPYPIYTVNPNGKTAASVDFRRINDMRPGYGYAGLPDPNAEKNAPADSGIWRVDLDTGKAELILSIRDVLKVPSRQKLEGCKHYFNHLLYNTDGTRLEFLHRWRGPGIRSFMTRMLTCGANGENIQVIDDNGWMSHFIWRDPRHILGWAGIPGRGSGFFLFPEGGGEIKQVGKGVMMQNGHCTYLPGNEWILNDTYPDRERKQHPYLYHVATGKKVPLGNFFLPPKYRGEWRCDTHPRFNPDGTLVCIDSPHEGKGRQLYLINIENIVK